MEIYWVLKQKEKNVSTIFSVFVVYFKWLFSYDHGLIHKITTDIHLINVAFYDQNKSIPCMILVRIMNEEFFLLILIYKFQISLLMRRDHRYRGLNKNDTRYIDAIVICALKAVFNYKYLIPCRHMDWLQSCLRNQWEEQIDAKVEYFM